MSDPDRTQSTVGGKGLSVTDGTSLETPTLSRPSSPRKQILPRVSPRSPTRGPGLGLVVGPTSDKTAHWDLLESL